MENILLNPVIDKCPCKDCKKRKISCHSTCKNYLEWVKKNEYLKHKERIEKVDVSSGWCYKRKGKRKYDRSSK